ncbi:dihydrofolate reductase family protein [Solicola gregarius]|uniref:Dihydrofolate reductase family protein n=1 Tax=Solicola gregarius TaxID=2908642 RepID=A0AA46TFJ3_9ACTN|nr:dihydrofolate reductase family protein [Solicola gregarius]UYM04176.1 dihydrofolate reductase family protein [Solicola gregarius]
MGKIIVIEHVTLDGVMQAPGRCDEDTSGGFAHGGWGAAGQDHVMAETMAEGMANPGPLLLGRRTYEDFAAYWPKQDDNPYTVVLNETQKYVVSSTLSDPLPWANSSVVAGDVGHEVARLKRETDADIGVLGSGALVETLAVHDLVDSYVLLIHPMALGSGRRLFADGCPRREFGLTSSVTTTTGVIIATYDRATNGA